MTKAKRIVYILQGIVMMLFAFMLFLYPDGALFAVALVLGVGMTLRGLRTLFYYFRMARYMVGGKRVLYRGIIFLDLGLFTAALTRDRSSFIIFYIAVMNAFGGLIAIMRALESRKIGSGDWIYGVIYGAVLEVSAAAIIFSEVILHQTGTAVYVYAAGMAYSAVRRILTAFRPAAIVYIP